MIRVLVAEDQEIIRSGIQCILSTDPQLTVVGSLGTGELNRIEDFHPDIVLVDIPPGTGGLELCHRIRQRHPEIKILAFSTCTEGSRPRHLLEAGVHGYLSKNCPPEEMIRAIKAVHRGACYPGSDAAGRTGAGDHDATSPFDRLSSRERQVMTLTLQGRSIQDIAAMLSVNPKTVCTYRYRIFDKLGIKNDVELTRLAARYHLLNGYG